VLVEGLDELEADHAVVGAPGVLEESRTAVGGPRVEVIDEGGVEDGIYTVIGSVCIVLKPVTHRV